MRSRFLIVLLSIGLLFATVQPMAAYHYRTTYRYVKHRRHMKTAKRVGIGAAGGAAIGALAAGAKGPASAVLPAPEQDCSMTCTRSIMVTINATASGRSL